MIAKYLHKVAVVAEICFYKTSLASHRPNNRDIKIPSSVVGIVDLRQAPLKFRGKNRFQARKSYKPVKYRPTRDLKSWLRPIARQGIAQKR